MNLLVRLGGVGVIGFFHVADRTLRATAEVCRWLEREISDPLDRDAERSETTRSVVRDIEQLP